MKDWTTKTLTKSVKSTATSATSIESLFYDLFVDEPPGNEVYVGFHLGNVFYSKYYKIGAY
jgi:hypothetical protein